MKSHRRHPIAKTAVVKTRGPFELAQYLPFLINRTGSALADAFSAELRSIDLTIPMWRVLAVLADRGVSRQIDVARLTSIEASIVSRVIGDLDRAGLVSRRRSSVSSREVAVDITAKGQKTVERLIVVAREYEKVVTRGLDAAELNVVRRCLEAFYENLTQTPAVVARKSPDRPA